MISTTEPTLEAGPSSTAPARPGARRLAAGRLLLGTAVVLGLVAVILSALAAHVPVAAEPSNRDSMFVVVAATSILLAVVGLAAAICGWVAAHRAPFRNG